MNTTKGIAVFGKPVPPRAIVGFIGEDAEAISAHLQTLAKDGDSSDLIVDYSLDLLDPLSRLRSRRELVASRHEGATILLATYREDLLAELCDEVWWIENGRVRAQGDPTEVLGLWNKYVLEAWRLEQQDVHAPMTAALTAGDGRARIRSVELLDAAGGHVGGWKTGERAAIRVVVDFLEPVADPVIGILIRTRIGLSVYGTNTGLEELRFGPRAAHDEIELTFEFSCDLCPGEYTLTVASHDPDGVWHEWLDDVIAFTVADARYTAGVANLRALVEWRLRDT